MHFEFAESTVQDTVWNHSIWLCRFEDILNIFLLFKKFVLLKCAYYAENTLWIYIYLSGQRCEFCSEQGHPASECPRRVTETKFGACSRCGSTDHVASECQGRDVITETCTRCKQEGHNEEDCQLESSDNDDDEDSGRSWRLFM